MKKNYFLFVLSFLFTSAYSQIVTIPDVQFKNKILSSTPFVSIATNSSGSYIRVDANQDGQIQQSEANAVYSLNVSNSSILDVTGIKSFTNINTFSATGNQISTADFSDLLFLKNLSLSYNLITSNSLNLSGLHLIGLGLNNNFITNIDQFGLNYVNILSLQNNQITTLNLTNIAGISSLKCSNNLITTLDVSACIGLGTLNCSNNPNLNTINLKNGAFESNLDFSNTPLLKYICSDESEAISVQNKITQYGYTDCHVNAYCSFSPGGVSYVIQGANTFDENATGCDASDMAFPNQKFIISNGSISSIIIPDASGNYSITMVEGTHTITPVLENAAYFNVTPQMAQVSFPATASPFVQNFCLAPNGIHNDLEVSLFPISPARPGFNASYKIVYKNKGTTTQSGHLEMTFDDNKSNFVTSFPLLSSQSSGFITWNYSNLLPLESREIVFVVQVNSPTQTPPINSGDYLGYRATVFPVVNDGLPYDNNQDLKQIVVNSLDPNDKTCAEGPFVGPESVGKYVHYIIRFENNGTYPAENVVVKDLIDLSKFDITTLTPVSSSHPFVTRISANNNVEFIFENINLPFLDATNDGYVAFKIKTLPSLVLGDTFTNKANIYFDYNFPIMTNLASTTIQALATSDFDFKDYFSLYPNPTDSVLNIKTKKDIAISSASIYNTIGQLVLISTGDCNSIDVSSLKTGSYFIKIVSNIGTASSKFIKN